VKEATLIQMLNRIGDFFAAMPEREQAMQGIADHVKKFWELRMRQQLQVMLAQPEHAEQLKPIVFEALQRFEWA